MNRSILRWSHQLCLCAAIVLLSPVSGNAVDFCSLGCKKVNSYCKTSCELAEAQCRVFVSQCAYAKTVCGDDWRAKDVDSSSRCSSERQQCESDRNYYDQYFRDYMRCRWPREEMFQTDG